MVETGPETPSEWRHAHMRATSVTATKFIRKLRGAAQAVLLQCSDDKYYLVKMHENPVGKHLLANEFIGSTLALASGVSIPNFEVVFISEEFIQMNQGLWFDGPVGRYPPKDGPHFGSSFMHFEWARRTALRATVSEYIPQVRVHDIVNRREFLQMLILDVFANKQTPRKALFVGGRLLRAYFVDQSCKPDNMELVAECSPSQRLHPEQTIYRGLWDARVVAGQIDQLKMLTELFLCNPLKSIPHEWYAQREAIDSLYFYQRLDDMPRLMKPYEKLLEA